MSGSCSCAALERFTRAAALLGPDETKQLTGVLETRTRPGEQRHSILLELDDGSTCQAEVRVNVVATYRLSQDLVTFSDVSDLAAPDVHVVRFSGDLATIAGPVRVSAAWLEADVHERAGTELDIVLKLIREASAPGYSVTRVEVPTTCDRVPLALITVRAWYPTTVIPLPRRVVLEGAREVLVRLVRAGQRESQAGCAVVEATASDPSVVCRVAEDGTLRLRRAQPASGHLRAYVSVRSSQGDRALVAVASDFDH